MNSGRNLVLLFLALAVIAALVYGLQPRPLLVDGEAVRRGPMRVTIEEEGKTRVIDRYVISPPVAGYLRRMDWQVGDAVRPSRVVARVEPLRPAVLDPRSRAEARERAAAAEAALEAAQEAVASAQAEQDYWEAELERSKSLWESGDIARDAFEQAETSARKARAAVRSAEFQVEVARHELEAARTALRITAASAGKAAETVAIRAPVAGQVLKVFRKSEGVVSAAEPLLEIGDPRALEVEVEALSSDAVQLPAGTKALLERWGGGEPLEAVVRRVEPVAFTKVSALGVEEQRARVILEITSPPGQWQRLGDQYRVEVSFILWEGEDVLQIPSGALFRYRDGWAAFAIEDGLARRRRLEVGRRSGLAAQVLSGLSEGEIVIAHPSDAIEDGAEVEVRGGGEG